MITLLLLLSELATTITLYRKIWHVGYAIGQGLRFVIG